MTDSEGHLVIGPNAEPLPGLCHCSRNEAHRSWETAAAERPSSHPRGNYWFTDRLGEGDLFCDPRRPTWGVFLQQPGMVTSASIGFFSEADAESFIRDDILGAGTDISEHKTVAGSVVTTAGELTP